MPRPLRAALPLLLLLLALAPGAGAQAVAPDQRWRTFDTEHFRVVFPDSLEDAARRLAARAETARARIAAAFVAPPGGRVHLVLTDHVDYANGSATPFPRPRVVVYAHPPVDDENLAFFEDWLEVVGTHELVHVFHLETASGGPRLLRRVFGRIPSSFPNLAMPRWAIEGLATELESRLTGEGRVAGTYHEMVLRTAALEDRLLAVDEASGYPSEWPGGNAAYVYGSMFLDHLARERGDTAAAAFVRRVGRRWVPYLLDDAARRAYGVSFTRGWRAWTDSLRAAATATAAAVRAEGVTTPEPLGPVARRMSAPRWAPAGQALAFAAADGREDVTTRVWFAAEGVVRRVAPRTSVGALSWEPDGRGIVTAQLEVRGAYDVRSDLWRVEQDGAVRRLTAGARLADPDVARDGRIVAIRTGGATTVPVLLDAEGRFVRALAAPSLDRQWSAPRWSPDGRTIALVAVDGTGTNVRLLAEDGAATPVTADRALDGTPTWSPDGRHLLFSSDRTGIPNLFAYDLREGTTWQVTNLPTGAMHPDVSPDGRWIAFAWYTADGWRPARIPFDPSRWRPAPPADAAGDPVGPPAPVPAGVGGPARPYSPWPTLLPTAWTPTFVDDGAVLGPAFGASVAGEDVVERHAWAASVRVHPDGGRVDGGAAYLFRGLGDPTIGVSAFQDWDVVSGPNTLQGAGGQPLGAALLQRERAAGVALTFRRPRFRSFGWWSVGAAWRDRDRVTDRADSVPAAFVEPVPEVGGVVTAGWSGVRGFERSIGPETGWLVGVTAEGRRFTRAIGADDGPAAYGRLGARVQSYTPLDLPGYARHVLAFRAAAAADVGERAPGYTVGGRYGPSLGYPLATAVPLGTTPDFPVRGYDDAAQIGDRAVAASAEYRFPLLRVERGIGLVPVWLGRTWGTLFGDAGAAWCVETCLPGLRREAEPRPIYAVGGELGAEVSVGFFPPVVVHAGVAVPLREADVAAGVARRPDPRVYVGLGRGF